MIYRTSEVSKIVGVHENTIRNYEKWGLISPVVRKGNGYRRFTDLHLNQCLLVHKAFKCTWMGGNIKAIALKMIDSSSRESFDEAKVDAMNLLKAIGKEKENAKAAIIALENYGQKGFLIKDWTLYSTKEASKLLDLSEYTLRDWEKNGLISINRNPQNGYRLYNSQDLERIKIIKVLRKADHSLMAILRMLSILDQGITRNIQASLDQKNDMDIFFQTDQWVTTLEVLEDHIKTLFPIIEIMRSKKSQKIQPSNNTLGL